MNTFLRVLYSSCTALYRTAVVLLLLNIASELAQSNVFLKVIFLQLYKVLGGATT
jgi:hypothetical protein